MFRVIAIFLTFLATVSGAEPRLLVHYMPWYATKDVSGAWGWHWTMNHFDPEQKKWDDQRKIASHDYPLIGPYDSGDDHALEYHALLMKIAGLDGVVIDWYGTSEINDHAMNHRNTLKFIPWLKKAGLSFAVCYEDQAVKSLKDGGDIKQAEKDLHWAEEHFFSDPSYVKQHGRPLLLVFGPQHLKWKFDLGSKPLVFGLSHLAKQNGLDGAFAWPPVAGGKSLSPEHWKKELTNIYAQKLPFIATAFPGFKDIYLQAGVHASYGSIASRAGLTLSESLAQALESKTPLIQIATWNDYGEGTMIEPTRSNGFRHLEKLPRCGNPADLRLPVMLYQLRKRGGDAAKLDEASARMFESKFTKAEALLASVSRELDKQTIDGGYHLTTELLYREGNGTTAAMNQRCRLDVYAPATKRPFSTVIWFHGGGLTQGERSIPLPLRNQGIAVVAANYRLSPGVKSPVFIEDAAAAIAWTFKHIADFGGDPQHIFVSGHSAGAYLTLMCGLDKKWLTTHGVDADQIAGLIPLSPQVITHFTIRDERGIAETQPIIDDLAPLFHVRKTAPPMLLVTGDREKELMGRYEECAYFGRMMKLAGHKHTTLHELDGFDHGKMPEPAFPLLLKFIETIETESAKK
ncbi:MAG: alpha/beta hydrolase fold domain-containing protein [Prosthecobacter sp.]|nr:alpha/beta hydrolase fold domain-containing protein [Prosthecobacter sp.]MCB1278675.1 alpha/beta hydrolase fold domain-containing protein [Prosthecobacter sp.]